MWEGHTDDRELLECSNCDLIEGVTFDGCLITYYQKSGNLNDCGFRFKELDEETFECPVCETEIKLCHYKKLVGEKFMNIVTIKGVSKDYDSLRAVDNIDLEIRKGECFGFLGPNGAGKTTIMGMIYCFMPPTSGEVRVFDLNVMEKPSEIKARIGVVPQEENLDPDLSVLENLIVYARYFNIPKNEALKRALELLEFVELKEKADVNINALSGGMKHRLILARALINNPDLIILDEPTVGLDPYSRIYVWERLNALKSKGTTLVLTTHYMEEAVKLCDRVVIMDKGKIMDLDSPLELMKKYGGSMEEIYLKLTGRKV